MTQLIINLKLSTHQEWMGYFRNTRILAKFVSKQLQSIFNKNNNQSKKILIPTQLNTSQPLLVITPGFLSSKTSNIFLDFTTKLRFTVRIKGTSYIFKLLCHV
jgi:hypothetical protein